MVKPPSSMRAACCDIVLSHLSTTREQRTRALVDGRFVCERTSFHHMLSMIGAALRAPAMPFVGVGRSSIASRAGALSMASDHVPNILFVECGMGCDQHGQTATKAAVRACRNAIEFNSLPQIRKLVPGGYEGMKLHVQLGVPQTYMSDIDEEAVKAVFPYGDCKIDVEVGGLLADSGIALEAMGDKNRDMIIAVACVTVGYADEEI